MSKEDVLLKRQGELSKSIGNAITNLNKMGKDNFTRTAVNVRINSLENSWKEFHENHITLVKILASAEEEDEESYFKEDSYATTEQRYLEALTLKTLPTLISRAFLEDTKNGQSFETSLRRKLQQIPVLQMATVCIIWRRMWMEKLLI